MGASRMPNLKAEALHGPFKVTQRLKVVIIRLHSAIQMPPAFIRRPYVAIKKLQVAIQMPSSGHKDALGDH